MEWLDIYWDADIEAYFQQHDMGRADVEEVIRNPIGEDISESSERPIRFGFSRGRKFAVVYEVVDQITVLPITGYEVK